MYVTRFAPPVRAFRGGQILIAGLGQRRLSTNDSTSLPTTAKEPSGQNSEIFHQNWLLVDGKSEEASRRFIDAVETAISASSSTSTQVRVALNCRGDNVSRIGALELSTLCFAGGLGPSSAGDKGFVVEFNPRHSERHLLDERVKAFKTLLECENVLKVMHDARMSYDALFHLYGIRLVNIHDTSCMHAIETGNADQPLNAILGHYGMEVSAHRGKIFYKENPHYWETRPLTEDMMQWCTSGLEKILTLADRQTETLTALGSYNDAMVQSAGFVKRISDCELQYGIKCLVRPHLLIGLGGTKIKSLMQRTQTSIFQDNATPRRWMVYYKTREGLDVVLREMGY